MASRLLSLGSKWRALADDARVGAEWIPRTAETAPHRTAGTAIHHGLEVEQTGAEPFEPPVQSTETGIVPQ